MTYEVNLLNPKAVKLLKNLAEMKLISISKISDDPFMDIVKQLRKSAAANPPSSEEITKEVEKVRAKRYAGKNQNIG